MISLCALPNWYARDVSVDLIAGGHATACTGQQEGRGIGMADDNRSRPYRSPDPHDRLAWRAGAFAGRRSACRTCAADRSAKRSLPGPYAGADARRRARSAIMRNGATIPIHSGRPRIRSVLRSIRIRRSSIEATPIRIPTERTRTTNSTTAIRITAIHAMAIRTTAIHAIATRATAIRIQRSAICEPPYGDPRFDNSQYSDPRHAAPDYLPDYGAHGHGPQDYSAPSHAEPYREQPLPPQPYPAQPYAAQPYADHRGAPQYDQPPLHNDRGEDYPQSYGSAPYGQDQQGYADPYYRGAPHPAEVQEEAAPRRRGGLVTVLAVLALAVVGTAAAFGYRAVFGTAGTPIPPVIRADASPTKVVPTSQSAENSNKPISRSCWRGPGTRRGTRRTADGHQRDPQRHAAYGVGQSDRAAADLAVPADRRGRSAGWSTVHHDHRVD